MARWGNPNTVVLLALVTVLTFTPVVAASNTGNSGAGSADFDVNKTAVGLTIDAIDELEDAELSGPPQRGNGNSNGNGDEVRKQRLLDDLNSTLDNFTSANRVDTENVFRITKRAASETQGRVGAVSSLLTDSSGVLAHTSLRDVERVLNALEERGISFDEDSS